MQESPQTANSLRRVKFNHLVLNAGKWVTKIKQVTLFGHDWKTKPKNQKPKSYKGQSASSCFTTNFIIKVPWKSKQDDHIFFHKLNSRRKKVKVFFYLFFPDPALFIDVQQQSIVGPNLRLIKNCRIKIKFSKSLGPLSFFF